MKKRLRDVGNCSICEVRIGGGWFCWHCYTLYKDNILSKEGWTKFLVNEENRRRRKYKLARDKDIHFVYFGDEIDITPGGKIIRREGS